MSPPVLAFAALVLVFVGALAIALRRGAAQRQRQDRALHAAAAAHGWSLRMAAAGGDGFELAGTSDDGIEWRLGQDATSASAGEAIEPAVVWSSPQMQSSALRLVVLARSAHARLAGGTGLGLADRLVRAAPGGGANGVPLHRLLQEGVERDLVDPALRKRFVLVSDDAALAAALIDGPVQAALRAWPDEALSIQVGAPDLRIRLGFVALDGAAIERIVDLGLRLARATRTAGLPDRAG